MKKTIVVLLIAVAGYWPSSALAAGQTHRCAPSQPSFSSLTATLNVSCAQARALNAYMATHETLAGSFRFGGATWLGSIYSRAHRNTYLVYRQNGKTIWIVFPHDAS